MRRGLRSARAALGLLALLAVASPLTARARVIVVGLDGAAWRVLDPMLAAGELPELAAIAAAGVTAELEAVEPVTSPVVWTSIATGHTPDKHGVRDFFSTALDVRTPTVFERLASRGHRVGLYDYLMTWPPAQLPGGFVIPGWLRRDARVTPPDLWERVPMDAWVNDYDRLKSNDDYRRNALTELRRKAPRWNTLADHFDVEIGAVTFYAPDAMSHRFWHGAHPEQFAPEVAALATDVERSALVDAMRGVDRAVGEIRARLAPEDTILLVSDHGFEANDEPRDVWVSHFERTARAAGLDPERDGFAILGEFGSLVIRVHPGPFDEADATTARLAELIESHRTPDGDGLYWSAEVLDAAPRPPGRERPLGTRVRQWVVELLLDWLLDVEIDSNAHAVVLALPRGGVLETLAPGDPIRVAGRDAKLEECFTRQVFTGNHDRIGIFLAAGGAIAASGTRGRISVLDVAPLVFYLAGEPIPDDLAGRVPVEMIAPAVLRARPVETVPADRMPGIARGTSAESGGADDPVLLEKLRRLGYIE